MENFHAEAYLKALVEATNNVQHLVIETKKKPVTAHENVSAATAVACMGLSDIMDSQGLRQFISNTVEVAATANANLNPAQDEEGWRAFLKWLRLSLTEQGLHDEVVDELITRHWECFEQPVPEVLLTHMQELRGVACHSSFVAKGHLNDVEIFRFIDRLGLGVMGVCVITSAGYMAATDTFLGPVMTPPTLRLGAGMLYKSAIGFKNQ